MLGVSMRRGLRPLVRNMQSRSVSSDTKLTVLPNQMRVATGEPNRSVNTHAPARRPPPAKTTRFIRGRSAQRPLQPPARERSLQWRSLP